MASTTDPTRNAATASPLSNLQLELLKLYGTGVSSEDLLEVKRLLGHHFAHKATEEADRLWDERQLSDEDMDAWLNE